MWEFGHITNSSDQILLFDYAVGAGETADGEGLNASRGDAILEIGSLGALYLTDLGAQPGGPHPFAVDVAFGDVTQRWWYEAGSTLDVTVQDGGSFELSGEGQTISGTLTTVFERGRAAVAESPTT